MTKLILHRVNRSSQLREVAKEFGVEIDLRSSVSTSGKLHLSHDPWAEGEDFESWLKLYCEMKISGPILLNTKEDGLENRIETLLSQYKVSNYFFIDTTLPTLIRLSKLNKKDNLSVRFSNDEPLALAQKFIGKVSWLWVDCFEGKPVPLNELEKLRPYFKVCLVSPELHGRSENIDQFKPLLPLADAVCTKHPERW